MYALKECQDVEKTIDKAVVCREKLRAGGRKRPGAEAHQSRHIFAAYSSVAAGAPGRKRHVPRIELKPNQNQTSANYSYKQPVDTCITSSVTRENAAICLLNIPEQHPSRSSWRSHDLKQYYGG